MSLVGWIAFDPDLIPRPFALTAEQEAEFFEAIADGESVKAAGKRIGLTPATAHSVFETFRKTLGEQGE